MLHPRASFMIPRSDLKQAHGDSGCICTQPKGGTRRSELGDHVIAIFPTDVVLGSTSFDFLPHFKRENLDTHSFHEGCAGTFQVHAEGSSNGSGDIHRRSSRLPEMCLSQELTGDCGDAHAQCV